MHDRDHADDFPYPEERQPAFNAPAPVLALIAAFVLVHLWRTQWLSPQADDLLLLTFAIIPPLYEAWFSGVPASQFPGGLAGLLLAPFGHFFLHANWPHVIMNAAWLLVFGTPVARRLGAGRFLLLTLLSAAAGGLTFLALHWGEEALLVGASGGVSGLMGASVRLIYADNLPLAAGLRRDVRFVRPLNFWQAMTLPRPQLFILMWIGINVAITLMGIGFGDGMGRIAGEAHIGGFFAGLALFGLFDKPRQAPAA